MHYNKYIFNFSTIIGAPRENTTGCIYRCPHDSNNKNCVKITHHTEDNQISKMFGYSLAQKSDNSYTVIQ